MACIVFSTELITCDTIGNVEKTTLSHCLDTVYPTEQQMYALEKAFSGIFPNAEYMDSNRIPEDVSYSNLMVVRGK